MTRARIVRSILSIFVGLGVFFGLGIVLAAPASAAPGDAQITNSSYSVSSLTVCKDFGPSSCSSGIGTLYAGQNTYTKFGWPDSDGFFCVSVAKYLVGSVWYTCSYSKWVKVSGGVIGRINVPIRVYNK